MIPYVSEKSRLSLSRFIIKVLNQGHGSRVSSSWLGSKITPPVSMSQPDISGPSTGQGTSGNPGTPGLVNTAPVVAVTSSNEQTLSPANHSKQLQRMKSVVSEERLPSSRGLHRRQSQQQPFLNSQQSPRRQFQCPCFSLE